MRRLGLPVAAIAAAMAIGCGSKSTPPVAADMDGDVSAPSAEAQVTMATATLSVEGLH